MKSPAAPRGPGRPPAFDRDAALERAMLLFWRHGYEATSLAMLTRAMGITPPSLYAAFGDKKGLFRAAVDRYLRQPLHPAEMVARAPDAAAAARWLLEGAATAFTGAETPAGCLVASAALAVSDAAEDLRQELAAVRQQVEAALRRQILDDIGRGALPPATDAEALAAYVTAVIQGLSTLARDGAPRARLLAVVRLALAAWPEG